MTSLHSDLLDALRSGGDLDFMREAMQLVLQALIDLEATEKIVAARYQRTDDRTNTRNGSRSRLLSTKAGDVDRQPRGERPMASRCAAASSGESARTRAAPLGP